ncbi:MAG TPA: lysylphosphatidylglycerol synthase domain-containing protein [Acidimicrobiales bacterium]|jgi:uncharacterized membrane protein YbhN (UPF0104 family)
MVLIDKHSEKNASRSWRRSLVTLAVGPRSEDPPRRRAADAVTVVVCLAVVIGTLSRIGSTSDLELRFAELLDRFPQGLDGIFTAALGLGALWAVVVTTALGALTGRRRLATQVLIAGVVTWFCGRIIVRTVGRHAPPPTIHLSGSTMQQYPVVRVALAVAIVATAAPYLTRLARWLGWSLVALTVIGAAARGIGLPSDIAGAVALGLLAAASVHLVFGSSAGRPGLDQIDEALSELGIAVTDVRFASRQPTGSTIVLARTLEGDDLFIRAYGRDDRDAQLLSKAWRFVWYEDSGPTLFLTRLQQVEHEAYAILLARHAGVPVPDVVAASTAGPATAVIVEQQPEGVALAELDGQEFAGRLDAVWEIIDRLRAARIAHGALDLSRLLHVGNGELIVVDFTRARTNASDAQLGADAARVLVATAARVGIDCAVEAALRHLGPAGLVDAVAYVQAPILTDPTRRDVRDRGLRLSELRAAAASSAIAEPPALAQLERVSARGIFMALATFVGIYVVLGQLGNFSDIGRALRHSEWGWIALAAAFSTATNFGYAMAYAGSTTAKLPLGRTVVLQFAGSFTNVVTPNAIGTAAINTRFLQARGVRLGPAIASQVVNTVGSGAVQVALFIALLPIVRGRFDLGLIPWRSLLTAVIAIGVAIAIAAGVTWQLPVARRFYRDRVQPALGEVNRISRSPSKVLLVVSGNVLVQLLYALSLGAICRGFGVTLPFSTLLLINIGSSAIAGLIPAPGGLGVAEATLAGALTATGVPGGTAVAITLFQRLVTTWLPPLPGWFALHALQKGDDL